MYKVPKMAKSQLKSVVKTEGETIETKIERLLNNKETIKDGAPMIYTERKQGVLAGYDIRTDRFEVACEKMDMINRSAEAKRQSRMNAKEEEKAIKESGDLEVAESKSVHGESTKK